MEEHEMIEHFFHEHPLRRVPNPSPYAVSGDYRWVNWCYGCSRFFLPGEVAYGCCTHNCGFRRLLHEECLEMPREIRHRLHPSHTLTQQDMQKVAVGVKTKCAVCEYRMKWNRLGYICSEGCEFGIHMLCAGGLELENNVMKKQLHPSHPQHELSFFRKKTRSFSFECDACGTMEKGNSCICTVCDYCIHESCAALPITADFPRHHPPAQTLPGFSHPPDYIRYEYKCAICRGALRLRRWVYHCQLCSYVVHIKCATGDTSPPATSTEINTAADHDRENIITAPINEAYEEIIKPFVKSKRAESREILEDDKKMMNGKFEFQHHHHPLSFITFSASPSSQDSDDDDDLENGRGLALTTCDGCTMPIHYQKSSTENGYMSCGECNYFLHLSCFNLPSELPSLPLHSIKDHKLMLRTNEKLRDWSKNCHFCDVETNGLIYACTECPFKVDIKCASLPDTIKHAAHPQDHHFLKLVVDNHSRSFCGACYGDILEAENFYSCHSCQFAMCGKCVWLPSRNKHRLEKHWLPLTYGAAYANHPSEFYCGNCEEKVFPNKWMYHCRDCDQSFHPECFPATSGEYRNINFGRQQYRVNVSTAHHLPHHPLTFQIITTKKRCNLCHRDVYEKPGFQCASCSFVMCLFTCGRSRAYELKDVNSND